MTEGAVILAAGLGSRLGALTADRPKAMVEVLGRPVIDRAVRALEAAGVRTITIITGHRREAIDAYVAAGDFSADVRTLHNPEFATANNIVSFLVSAPALADGGLLLNSDVIFDPAILRDLLAAPAGAWLSVDDTQALDAEDMKVELGPDHAVRRISKGLDPATARGEYIGLARLDRAAVGATVAAAEALVRHGGSGLYYEDAFDRSAAEAGFRIRSTGGALWTEIDDQRDYERAVAIMSTLTTQGRP